MSTIKEECHWENKDNIARYELEKELGEVSFTIHLTSDAVEFEKGELEGLESFHNQDRCSEKCKVLRKEKKEIIKEQEIKLSNLSNEKTKLEEKITILKARNQAFKESNKVS